MLNLKSLKAELLLLLTALIWGFAFVAQRVGMDHVGPFTYTGVRFLLGALSLLPLLLIGSRASRSAPPKNWRTILAGSLLAGLFLFAGATLQQLGLVHTTAGKAGFITGLYVVIVPLLGLFWHSTPSSTWVGAGLAVIGLYLLTMTDGLTLAEGDGLVLAGAFFWAGHVLVIGWLSGRIEPVLLACLQITVCGVLSLGVALAIEPISLRAFKTRRCRSCTAVCSRSASPTPCKWWLNATPHPPMPRSFSAWKPCSRRWVAGCCWTKPYPAVGCWAAA